MIPIDWNRVEKLYRFTHARARCRVAEAEHHRGPHNATRERHDLRVLEAMYAEARQHDDVVAACAVTYFRARAMRDAHHPDFLGEWIRPTVNA